MIDMKWDEKFVVGHERVDQEHKVFLDLINNLSVAEKNDMPKERVLRLLEEISRYANFHLYSEENLMIDSDYSGYEAHKKDHELLLATLIEQIHNYQIGTSGLDELVEFIFHWFATHTTEMDNKLTEHINANH